MTTIIHYTGHMFNANHELETQLAVNIRSTFGVHDVDAGFGSLAAGSDILFAEALLGRGAALNLFLPFDPQDFLQTSVCPYGKVWMARFEKCLSHADQLTILKNDLINEISPYHYATKIAIKNLLNAAQDSDATMLQVAISDGKNAIQPAGTAADIATWHALGHPTVEIVFPCKRP